MGARWIVMAVAASVAIAAGGCGGALRGNAVAVPSEGNPVATATTADPGGVRVLANGRAGDGEQGLLATTPAQLAALWSAVGLAGPPPAVDFATHVVLGTNFEGGVCQPEIVGARVDAHGTLILDEQRTVDMCILLAVRVARVVAVPRAILTARFTWRARPAEAYAFALAGAPPAAVSPSSPPGSPSLERASIDRPRGVVDVPRPGHVGLRTLDDGRQVWVAVRAGGDVSVVAADAATPRAGVRVPIAWRPALGRLDGGYDARGRSIDGGRPLDTLAFARVAATRIAIGATAPLPDGPIERRDLPLVLDGPAHPYAELAPGPLAGLADGRLGAVTADLVWGIDGVARVCVRPTGKLASYLPGCPAGAPELIGGRLPSGPGVAYLDGPLIVRRAGGAIDLVIDPGHGEGAYAVEHTLHAPAPRGATRDAGELTVGVLAHGDTAGAKDGFTPPCIPPEAAGGPDERWTLTATARGRYAIELDGDHDGVLAVVADDGSVLACNDDRHGDQRSSVVHVELALGAKVHVIVDAFGGDSQRYTLAVRADPDLPDGGVLTLGKAVRGDTSHAIDEHSVGCYAPAGDHAYLLTVDTPGAYYTVHIETPGWPPLLEVARGDDLVGCRVNATPLDERLQLEPGTYTIIVDGGTVKAAGPYLLRVDPAPAVAPAPAP